jgi:hypothetical protein
VIGGTFDNPKLEFNFSALTGKAKENVKEQTEKTLKDAAGSLLQKLGGDKKK